MKLALFLGVAAASGVSESNGKMTKVIQLLKDLKAKTEAEQAGETEQYEKYFAWSEKTVDETEDAIEDGMRAEKTFQADIEEGQGNAAAANAEITRLAQEIAQGDADLAEAKALKKEDEKNCEAAQNDLRNTLDQLERAIRILKANFDATALVQGKGVTAMLQGLKAVITASSLEGSSKSQLASLLEESDDDDYSGPAGAPEGPKYESKVGQVIEACEQLRIEAQNKLRESQTECLNKRHASEMTIQKLTDEMAVDNKDLERNKGAAAEAEEQLNTAKGKLAETEELLKDNRATLAEVKMTTKHKENEQASRAKARQDELAAIDKAIEILSGRFGLVQESFVQTETTYGLNKQVRDDVAHQLMKIHSVALQQLATRIETANDPFVKVRGLIENLIANLEEQAKAEATHHTFCVKNLKETRDKRDKAQADVEKYDARVASATAKITTLKEEIASLQAEVVAMQDSMREATQLRVQEAERAAAEHAEFLKDLEALEAAYGVLKAQFSFVQQPATADDGGDFATGNDSASGILAILETAKQDMTDADVKSQTMEAEAKRAFEEFEQTTKVALAKAEGNIKGKQSEVAAIEQSLENAKSDASDAMDALDAVNKSLEKLEGQCTHKPMTFAERAAKRQQEIEGLKEALRILNEESAGAGEFLQKRVSVHLA